MPRGYSKETRRGDAAAATWMFRGDESRRCNADVPRRRVAAMQRGYSAETRRGDAAAATRGSPRRTIGAGVRVVRRGRRGLRLRAPQKYGRVPKAAVGQDRSRPRVARGAPHEGGPALGPRDGADAVLQWTARGVVAQTAAGGRRVRGVACRGLCFGRLRRAGDGDPGLRGRGVVHAAIGLFRVAERGARPRAARPGAGHRLPEPRVRGGRGGRVRDAGLLRGTAWIFRGVGSAELEAARRRKNLSPKRSSFVDVRGRVAATPRGATWIFREGDRPSSTRGFARRFERTAFPTLESTPSPRSLRRVLRGRAPRLRGGRRGVRVLRPQVERAIARELRLPRNRQPVRRLRVPGRVPVPAAAGGESDADRLRRARRAPAREPTSPRFSDARWPRRREQRVASRFSDARWGPA